MVEAAKAYNPFAPAPVSEATNCCPHMERLGICLEPAMCFLLHKLPGQASSSSTQAELSTAAKAFNPFAATSTDNAAGGNSSFTPAASKEFVPSMGDNDGPKSEQAGIL